MVTFWSDFWPNLAATAVGVAVGVPLGLWLNRRAVDHGEEARRRGERAGVSHTLEALGTSVQDNVGRLETFSAVLSRKETLFDTGLDGSAWAALQAGLTSELKDPTLRQLLARFFARLGGIVAMNQRYLDVLVGVDAAIANSGVTREKLGAAIPDAVSDLIRDGKEVLALIETAKGRLSA